MEANAHEGVEQVPRQPLQSGTLMRSVLEFITLVVQTKGLPIAQQWSPRNCKDENQLKITHYYIYFT